MDNKSFQRFVFFLIAWIGMFIGLFHDPKTATWLKANPQWSAVGFSIFTLALVILARLVAKGDNRPKTGGSCNCGHKH